jgi:hypothetical protein
MARFHNMIGFATTTEKAQGVYTDNITEREYFGTVIRDTKQNATRDQLNDNLVLSNRISVVGDDFAYQNFSAIRYVKFAGSFWKVTSVEIRNPRLIISFGGAYNGPKA